MAAQSNQTPAEKEMNASPGASYSVMAWPGQQLPEQYRNMVYSKWMRSLRFGNDYFRLCDATPFFTAYQRYIGSLLSRAHCVVRTAVLTDDHDVCLGFSVSEPGVLHYVHVQKDNRKQGIARSLVPFQVETITHLTKQGMRIWAEKIPQATFNPFL